MIYPTLAFQHMKVRRAIRGYPVFDVPNKEAERSLSEDRVEQNFNYFMRVRLDRLAFFQSWLRESFGIRATLDGGGLLALNSWIDGYGGGLVGDSEARSMVFATYKPAWIGKYAGYNVLVDIAVFVGEYLISMRPKLHWEIYRGHPDDDGELTGPNLKRPQLAASGRMLGLDVLGLAYGVVAEARNRSHVGHNRHEGDQEAMIKACKTSLHLANVVNDGKPFIFGDYSNEPI